MRMAFLLLLTALPLGAQAAPCTSATPACTYWVALKGGPARSLIYTSFPLDKANPAIRRALIMVHGTLRNPDHYFNTASAAAFLAGAQQDTVVIAPRFASHSPNGRGCTDTLADNEVNWSCGGDSWRSGGASTSNPDLTSFDFVDEILRRLADKKVFPNLTVAVIAGHSAGGQFVDRYEMANQVDGKLGISLRYVVANPSSYAWPDATRPRASEDAYPANAGVGWQDEKPHTNFTYGRYSEASQVPGYDVWPYGLEHRTTGYTAKMSDDQLRQQLVSRDATYLLSQVDTLPLGGFDSSADAMAQGPTRRARGEAFVNYVNQKLGGHHNIMIVPECGHNDRCVYTTRDVLNVIFPK
ncbi:MAG TPA: alpha/beta fold hydrolase [Terriglobales bacterium]